MLVRVTPDVRGETRTRRSRPARPTRSSASRWPRRREAIARVRAVDGLTLRGRARAHRLPAARARAVPSRGRPSWPSSATFPVLGPRRRSRRALHRGSARAAGDRGVRRRDRARPRAPRHGRRAAPADRAGPGAVRERLRDAVHGRERQAATSRAGWPSTAACPTTCARCSTARATRRTWPTASAARPTCVLAGKHCESGDVIVRDALLDDPRPGDVIVTPATGAYGYAMANNYNGVPAPAGDLLQRRRRARGGPARELRGSDRARCRRRGVAPPMPADGKRAAAASRSACSGTAPSARRSRRCSSERAGEIARFNGRRPVISGVLTRSQRRLRGDPRRAPTCWSS